jgi:5'-nucleotidase
MASELLLIHYNDVYNVEPLNAKPGSKDLIAGATRFAGKLKSFSSENPLVLFSGDAFNPSSSESHECGRIR